VRIPWRVLLGRPDLWFLTAAYTVLGYIGYIYFSWFYLYLVNERHFSIVSGGWYSTLPFVVSALAAPLGGWLSDSFSRRFGKRIGRCGLGFSGPLGAAGFIWTGAAVSDPYLSVLCLSLGEGLLFLTVAAFWAVTIDLAKTHAGTVSGFMNMGGNLGGAISPTLTPLIAQRFGWDSALYVAAVLAFLSAFFWLGVHPERAIDLGEDAPAPSPQKKVTLGVEPNV